MQEQIDKILAIGINRISNKNLLTQEEIQLIKTTYEKLLNKTIQVKCGACLIDAWYTFRTMKKERIEELSNLEYKLDETAVIDTTINPIAGVPDHVTNANLTNEIGASLIKAGFKRQFVKFPQEEAEVVPPVVEEPLQEITPVAEEPIQEVAPAEPAAPKYSKMSAQALKAECVNKGYVASEWANLNKEKLVKYLESKEVK